MCRTSILVKVARFVSLIHYMEYSVRSAVKEHRNWGCWDMKSHWLYYNRQWLTHTPLGRSGDSATEGLAEGYDKRLC